MDRDRKKSILPYIPGYDNNTVLKLIFFVAGAYIMLALTWAVFMMVNITDVNFNKYLIPNLSLPHVGQIANKWWTVLTYGLFHVPNSFMHMLSNMLWLYCFGSVVQMLIGKNQIIPLFAYCLVAGGLCYLGAQLLPGGLGRCPEYIMGPRAGLAGMCAAAITISPRYRFYLTETFSVPMAVVAGIFAVLMIMETGYYLPVGAMVAGGALTGFGYIKLLKNGYRPGAWMYSIGGRIENMVTPDAHAGKRGRNTNENRQPTLREKESRLNEILDKINRKGYNSLSNEEKEYLRKASQD